MCVYEEFEITAAINQAHFYYKEKKGSYLTATASWNKWQGGQGIMFCNSSNRIWKMEVINNISNRLPILLTSKFYEWYPQFRILDWRQEKSILKYSSRYMNIFLGWFSSNFMYPDSGTIFDSFLSKPYVNQLKDWTCNFNISTIPMNKFGNPSELLCSLGRYIYHIITNYWY